MSYITIRFDYEDRFHPAPEFRLASTQGTLLTTSQLYSDGSLILMFLHASDEPNCRDFLSLVQSHIADYQQQNAQVAVLFPQPIDEIHLNKAEPPLTILADPDRNTFQKYARLFAPELVKENDILLFVLDNHGGIYTCLVGAEPEAAAHDELLTWIDYISIQCPE